MELLRDLVMSESPSGMEGSAVEVFSWKMEMLGAREYYSDKIGNVAYSIGDGPVKVLLSAHIDSVNGRIQSLESDGRMTFISTGGLDRKSLISSHVEVLIPGTKKKVYGIIGKKPIHLEHGTPDWSRVSEIREMLIDVGVESREELEDLGLHVGCPVIYRRSFMELGKNRVVSVDLDDKAGVWIVLRIMEELIKSGIPEKYTIIGLATVQEETGCRGAKIASRNIDADISIDFDVQFEGDKASGINIAEVGDTRLGKGGILSWGPDKSIRLCCLYKDLSMELGINLQHDSTSARGTNTSAIQEFSSDCETLLISIPNRNMHTPVEMCDKRDLRSIVDLVSASLKKGLV